MNKKELIAAIAEKAGFTKKDTGIVLEAFIDVVVEALARREDVKLVGFGTFTTAERSPRECRNPQTGETFMSEAKVAPKLKFGKAVKDAVNA